MLNRIGGVSYHSGNQDFAVRQLYVFPDPPLMFVARVGTFD